MAHPGVAILLLSYIWYLIRRSRQGQEGQISNKN